MALLFKYIGISCSTYITSYIVTISLITTIILNIGYVLYQTSIVKTVTIISGSLLILWPGSVEGGGPPTRA